jgi:thiol-disulfide isomerase/thioredoxin
MFSQQFNSSSDANLGFEQESAVASAFTLNDVDGKQHNSNDWQGKTVVLNFWATWCPPCRREIPLLIAFVEQQPDFQVVGIAIDDPEAVKEFSDEIGINYINLVGQADAIKVGMEHGNASGALPYTVVISPEGKIIHRVIGELDEETLESWAMKPQ